MHAQEWCTVTTLIINDTSARASTGPTPRPRFRCLQPQVEGMQEMSGQCPVEEVFTEKEKSAQILTFTRIREKLMQARFGTNVQATKHKYATTEALPRPEEKFRASF